MRISVKVKPGSKEDKVTKSGENEFLVRVKSHPVDGKANESLIKLLSDYFSVPKSRISIARGAAGKNKIIDIG
jgi:uncharacterized protein (TIGR00251 family)